MVKKWLKEIMFKGEKADSKINKIVKELLDHTGTKTHSRHISKTQCKSLDLKIIDLKTQPNDLQDIVLTVHHSFMHTFAQTPAVKIIENHKGKAVVHQITITR